MKKIISSFLLILFIVTSVSASAYALFSSTASVSGLSFSTGNADLQISLDSQSWSSSVSFAPVYSNMAPGFSNAQEFYLKNTSLSDVNLDVFIKLIDNSPASNSAAWGVIGDKITISFQKTNGSTWTNIATGTLSQWKNTGFDLATIGKNDFQKYQLLVTLGDVSDEDSGQDLSNLSFQFLGTQQ